MQPRQHMLAGAKTYSGIASATAIFDPDTSGPSHNFQTNAFAISSVHFPYNSSMCSWRASWSARMYNDIFKALRVSIAWLLQVHDFS